MNNENRSFGLCDVCGAQFDCVLYPVNDTNQGVAGNWEIIQCSNCGLGKLYPTPSEGEVSGFYLDSFYTPDGKRFRPSMEWLREKLAAIRGQHIREQFPNGGSLIDIGAGSGHFGKAMESYGWSVVNFDPYSSADKNVTSATTDKPFAEYLDNSFDVITMWYVIEHLLAPREAIKECFRILKPGGLLVLSQQDFSSIQAKFFGPRWLILDPPRHIFQFSPKNLKLLTAQEQFGEHYVDHASLEMGPYTILQSFLNSIVGNGNYLFKFLKSRGLRKAEDPSEEESKARIKVFASIALLPLLAPFSLLIYFFLLLVGSGDIFTLYARKPKDAN